MKKRIISIITCVTVLMGTIIFAQNRGPFTAGNQKDSGESHQIIEITKQEELLGTNAEENKGTKDTQTERDGTAAKDAWMEQPDLRRIYQMLSDYSDDISHISHHGDQNGFIVKYYVNYIGDDEVEHSDTETVSVHMAEELPRDCTREEMRDYLLRQYPGADSYFAYPLEEEESEGYPCFYIIKEGNITYARFTYMGQAYEAVDEGREGYYNCISHLRSDMGYDSYEDCEWERSKSSIVWQNFIDRKFYLEQDIGAGELFRFQLAPPKDAKPLETEFMGLMEYGEDLEVSVYRGEEREPFQIFQTSSVMYSGDTIFLEDFNADGYLDLTVIYYYGANGGSASHYLWSPSREQFVQCSDELSYFGAYSVNAETRRLHIHYHGSALSGTEYMYQWENETDCTLIRKMEYGAVKDLDSGETKEYFRVMAYEDGREQILLDYEGPLEYPSIAEYFYYDDIVWDREVQDSLSGERYHLYYAQRPNYDQEGEVILNDYTDCLYVIDANLYPVNYLEWKSGSACAEVMYIEHNDDMEGIIEVWYADGQRKQLTSVWCESNPLY